MNRRLALCSALAVLMPLASALADGVRVEKPWARATAPGVDTGGVFVTLRGEGVADQLVGVDTEAAQMAMLHETTVKAGVSTMRDLQGVPVPKDGTVVLRPGSFHIMLMGLAHPLKQGEHFSATLRFAKAAPVTVDVPVAAIGATSPP